MARALGIISFSENHIWVDGLEDYRSIAAFSFLGRYRVIDFQISNMSNSGIDRIQVYIRRRPQSLVGHIGTGRHFNINSKSGYVKMMFTDSQEENDYYNTDIKAYLANLEHIENTSNTHVVIAPGYMVYTQDFDELLKTHIDSEADITVLYHSVDDAKEKYQSCYCVNLNRQKGVESFERNNGKTKNRNIFMDTYVMKKELFIELLKEAKKASSMYTLRMIINDKCRELDIRGVAHRGFFAPITDFKSYYDGNMALADLKTAQNLFKSSWPIYTRTSDSCPTQYSDTAVVKKSFLANGCMVDGTVENSVVGRDCVIKPGAVVKNCILLTNVVVGEGVHIEGQVVDKNARVVKMKEVIADPEHPGYIRRNDSV